MRMRTRGQEMQERRGDGLRIAILFLLCLAGSAGVFSLIFDDISHSRGYAVPVDGVVLGRDFVNVWIGGKHVWRGALDSIYDLPNYLAFMRDYFPYQSQHNYSYPPPTLFIGAIFSILPYPIALATWTLVTAGLFLFAARRYVSGFPLILAVLTPGALANIWDGQYGFAIGACWLFLFANFDKFERKSGSAAAVLTIKPHLGVLIPLILLARGRFSTIWVAAVGTFALFLISAMVFGPQLWMDYFNKVPGAQLAVLNSTKNEFYFNMMPTTMVTFRNYPHAIALMFQALTAAIAVFMVWKARHADAKSLAFVASTATFLFLPYAFNYDMPVLCLGLIVLMSERWRTLPSWELIILALGAMMPGIVLMQNTVHVPFAPMILLGCLFVQTKYATESRRGTTTVTQEIHDEVAMSAAT
jgi:hypothetical protein